MQLIPPVQTSHSLTGDKGIYLLICRLVERLDIRVGALGNINFHSGYYCYIGSAMGGLAARINRHLRQNKRLHWHIDYLLQHAEIIGIHIEPGNNRNRECALTGALAAIPEAVAVPGFGAGDCRCSSHLYYFPQQPVLDIPPPTLYSIPIPAANQVTHAF